MKIPAAQCSEATHYPGCVAQGLIFSLVNSLRIKKKNRLKARRLSKNSSRKAFKLFRYDSFSTNQNSNFSGNNENQEKTLTSHPGSMCSETYRQNNPHNGYQPIQEEVLDESIMSHLETIEYQDAIYKHLLSTESLYIPNPIITSRGCTSENRNILVRWVFQLSTKLMFKNQTTFLCINIIDRSLGALSFNNEELPLLAITALYMAIKYEEITCPKLGNLVAILSPKYQIKSQSVLALEAQILIQLDFNLNYTSPTSYICDVTNRLNMSMLIKDQVLEEAKELIIGNNYKQLAPRKLALKAFQVIIERNQMQEDSQEQYSQSLFFDLRRELRIKFNPQY